MMQRDRSVTAGRILTNHRPAHVPPAYWRRLEPLRYWAVFYLMGWLGYGLLWMTASPHRIISVAFFLLWGAMVFILDYAAVRINRRLCREVIDNEYWVCITCGYSLRHLPAKHQCPECGAGYDVARLERDWKAWYGESG